MFSASLAFRLHSVSPFLSPEFFGPPPPRQFWKTDFGFVLRHNCRHTSGHLVLSPFRAVSLRTQDVPPLRFRTPLFPVRLLYRPISPLKMGQVIHSSSFPPQQPWNPFFRPARSPFSFFFFPVHNFPCLSYFCFFFHHVSSDPLMGSTLCSFF